MYNNGTSRDFCNSFWGVGDSGVNILFARMKGAAKTTDDLRNFWHERALIEEEYASKLMSLSKMTIGKDEIGELRNAVNTLKLETEKLASSHTALANQIRNEMEESTAVLLNKQIEQRKTLQQPLEKRHKAKANQETYVAKAREKYQGDCLRISSYTKAIEQGDRDAERIQQKLKRAQQTVQANEQDYRTFSQELMSITPAWEADWKDFCDVCQDAEEERLEFMKDTLWAYANAVSTVCVADDVSCETIRTVLDQLEPERDVGHFVRDYGTGPLIQDPIPFVPYNGQGEPAPNAPTTRTARFIRNSKRPAPSPLAQNPDPIPTYDNPPPTQAPPQAPPPAPVVTTSQPSQQASEPRVNGNSTQPSKKHVRDSQPLPPQPEGQPAYANPEPPTPAMPSTAPGGILFYVKALYDYTATIDEEFDFQAGDVIAVTATPEDGWWSGVLLDEARREEGRHIFPSNFVTLF